MAVHLDGSNSFFVECYGLEDGLSWDVLTL